MVNQNNHTTNRPIISNPRGLRALALGLMIILAACGDGSSSEAASPSNDPTQSDTSIQTTDPVPDPTNTSTTNPTSAAENTTPADTTPDETTESTETGPPTEPCPPGVRPIEGEEYEVINVKADDVLNIRFLPGHTTTKVGALSPDTTGLRPTGICRMVGTGVWWELDSGAKGAWINSKFLAPMG